MIKAVVPVIKGFADAIKTAADFIVGPINAMKDAIGGFIKFITDAFQGFYNWLVGGSLWMDLWNQVVAVAGMIPRLRVTEESSPDEPAAFPVDRRRELQRWLR